MRALTSSFAHALSGTITVPGDKSISHRAVMFASLAEGTTRIEGLLHSEDVQATADAMSAMGATITAIDHETYEIIGVGENGLKSPETTLDMGNSGTSTRLLAGIVGSYPITATFDGDASLRKRPMNRIIVPLGRMGIEIAAQEGGLLPMTITGREKPVAIDYETPVASAQIKSAILLAGLNANGRTSVKEPSLSRDHTERMLGGFGVKVTHDDGRVGIEGGQKLIAPEETIIIPGDPSSAAFAIVAGLIVPDSDITIQNVGLNPTRIGLINTLRDMGGSLEILNKREVASELVGDVRVRHSQLRGVTVPEDRVPSMIDEFPILAVAASCAEGATNMTGLSELRVKESDRLSAIADGLRACGVRVADTESNLTVLGEGKAPKGGATITTHLDHRIAMAFLVMGAITEEPVTIDNASAIATSFPSFVALMNGIGLKIKE